jgi:hypothetical protein
MKNIPYYLVKIMKISEIFFYNIFHSLLRFEKLVNIFSALDFIQLKRICSFIQQS